jgi:hypothetical protein
VQPNDLLRLRRDLDIFTYAQTPDDDMLRRSLHPPIVIGPSASGRRIVWGWHIVRAAMSLGISELPTKALETGAREQLSTALALEARPGAFALSEQDAILRFAEEQEVPVGEIAQLVTGDGSFQSAARRYRSLCDAGRDLVDAEVVDLKTALRLTEPTTRCLFAFRHDLAEYSVSNRRIIATLVDELSRRDRLSRDACESLLEEALASPDPRGYLQSRRYPSLTAVESRFERVRRDALSGTGVELHHPPYFEGDAFEVRFQFRSARELTDRAKAVFNLEAECDELFDLL